MCIDYSLIIYEETQTEQIWDSAWSKVFEIQADHPDHYLWIEAIAYRLVNPVIYFRLKCTPTPFVHCVFTNYGEITFEGETFIVWEHKMKAGYDMFPINERYLWWENHVNP